MSERRDPIDNILALHRACPEAVVWSRRHRTLEEAWDALEAPDWALWALDRFGYRGERELRLFAAACARRSQPLWDDPACARAIDVATRAASGQVDASALRAAYLATRDAASAIVDRPDYTEAMAAAACAASAALRDRAIDAANDASRESARAITWSSDDPRTWRDEAVWQCAELRRLVGPDAHALAAEVRRGARGALHVL